MAGIGIQMSAAPAHRLHRPQSLCRSPSSSMAASNPARNTRGRSTDDFWAWSVLRISAPGRSSRHSTQSPRCGDWVSCSRICGFGSGRQRSMRHCVACVINDQGISKCTAEMADRSCSSGLRRPTSCATRIPHRLFLWANCSHHPVCLHTPGHGAHRLHHGSLPLAPDLLPGGCHQKSAGFHAAREITDRRGARPSRPRRFDSG